MNFCALPRDLLKSSNKVMYKYMKQVTYKALKLDFDEISIPQTVNCELMRDEPLYGVSILLFLDHLLSKGRFPSHPKLIASRTFCHCDLTRDRLESNVKPLASLSVDDTKFSAGWSFGRRKEYYCEFQYIIPSLSLYGFEKAIWIIARRFRSCVTRRKEFLRELSLLRSIATLSWSTWKIGIIPKAQTLPLVCQICSSVAERASGLSYIYSTQQSSQENLFDITDRPGMHGSVQGRSWSHLFPS